MAKDFLWLNINSLPYFRGLLRAVEARFYQEIPIVGPILDMGCGDGHFARITFDEKLDVGIDPWISPLKRAAKSSAYRIVTCADGGSMPFENGYFNTVISNSVLEHIVELNQTLSEISRVLADGGLFLFCVPNHKFLSNLSVSSFLDRIKLRPLGNIYRNFFNRISRHDHCDSPEVWINRLLQYGFKVDQWWHYFSPKAFHILEWGHYFGLPSLVSHILFQRWILVPRRWNLALTNKIVKPIYDEANIQENGSYTFYIARKNAN